MYFLGKDSQRRLEIKPLFAQGPSIATKLVVVVILSVVLMVLDHRQNHLEFIRSGLSIFVYPLQYLVNIPVSAGSWMGESLSTRSELLKENEELRMQSVLLKTQLQKLSAVEAENLRLRELLQSSRRVGERVLIAEMLAVDLDPFSRQIVIDKGSTFNVYDGQPILDADGVMGQVVHVGPMSSTAMLITDPNHAIPVEVNRNGLRAIAMGIGASGYLDLPNIPINADIEVGDLLVTSGLGGRFPRGYPVGKVMAVQKDPAQPYATVTAQPSAKLDRSREVLLVWPEGNKLASPIDEALDSIDGQPGPTKQADSGRAEDKHVSSEHSDTNRTNGESLDNKRSGENTDVNTAEEGATP